MSEHTQLQRPKPLGQSSASTSSGAPQGKQLFVNSSSRMEEWSELVDTTSGPDGLFKSQSQDDQDY